MRGHRGSNRRVWWVLFLAGVWLWAVPVSAKAPEAENGNLQLSCRDANAEKSSRHGTFHIALSPARRRPVALAELVQDAFKPHAGKQSVLCLSETVSSVANSFSTPQTNRDRQALFAVRRE